jgi:Holliday junction resolvase-like predicted endonuclease
MKQMTAFHVSVAAEAFAAGVLAQAGYDVLVQYGANQPEYDLIASKGGRYLKVSVKGSQDGGWGLIQSYKKKGNSYHDAVDDWVSKHGSEVTFCFVQFEGVALGACPRIYLARVAEVAILLKASRRGHGNTILYENYTYKRGLGAGTTDRLPDSWKLSRQRVDELVQLKA